MIKTNQNSDIAADVIDAEVVSEQRAHAHKPMAYEKTILATFMLVVLSFIVFLADMTHAHQSQAKGLLIGVEMRLPVLVVQPQVAHVQIQPAQQKNGLKLVSFQGMISEAKKMQHSAGRAAFGTNIPPVGSLLTPESYQEMLAYLAQKEGITHEKDARDVLLQAGYGIPSLQTPPASDYGSHLAFARDVVNTLVRDEVESFLGKIQVVSKVGAYVATVDEEHHH